MNSSDTNNNAREQDFEAVKRAAEQGSADAQFNLGVMYAKGFGVTQDYAEAMKWYKQAAEQGYVPAQYNLGMMYDKGLGIARNDAEAVKWYRNAAEQGLVLAQNNLGWMYYSILQ
jgi:TPR repeat protein